MWLSPMTPSATAADSRLSMAPSMAMVRAGDTRLLTVSHVMFGISACGRELLMEKRSPMVSMVVTPAYCFSSSATTVITMMAISEPGIFLLILGISMMTATLATPMTELHRSAVEKLAA